MTEFKPNLEIKRGVQDLLKPGDSLAKGTVVAIYSASGGTIRAIKGEAVAFKPHMDYYVCYSREAKNCAVCPHNKKKTCHAPLAEVKASQ